MRLDGFFIAFVVLVTTIISSHTSAEQFCYVTQRPPSTPFALEMCYMYSHSACCLSGYDLDIKAAYESIVPGGPGCSPGSLRIHAMLYDLLLYLCLPCNPNEPIYRFESVLGDQVDGGIVPPSLSSQPGEYTWRICKSFLYGAPGTNEGIWGRNASQYNSCGIQLQSCLSVPIFDIQTAQFTYPSSTCKSKRELVIPSIAFEDTSDPALEMLSLIAQTMSDFQIVIVDDSDPNYDYDKTPCFGRSNSAAIVLSRAHAVATLLLVAILCVT